MSGKNTDRKAVLNEEVQPASPSFLAETVVRAFEYTASRGQRSEEDWPKLYSKTCRGVQDCSVDILTKIALLLSSVFHESMVRGHWQGYREYDRAPTGFHVV